MTDALKENTPNKIAIFRALFLGDTLCIIPVVRALRNRFPEAEISLIGLPWQQEIVDRFHKYFNRFIRFPGWPGLPEQHADPIEVIRFIQQMQSEKFDLVLQMQGNGVLTNAMCMLWDGRNTYGLSKPGENIFDKKQFPESSDDEHEVKRFLKLVDALGVPRQDSFLEFPLTAKEELQFLEMSAVLNLIPKQYVCIHPGSKDPRRRWPVDHFAFVGDQLAANGYQIVITGSQQELTVAESVIKKMTHPAINAIKAFEPIDLWKLVALIKHAKLLVSNDTGVSHLAAAVRTASVIIFSPYSVMSRWAPENNVLHRIIPHEKSCDPIYVWTAVQNQLLLPDLTDPLISQMNQ
jgi:ADP-heptose:LPS heptosyltransferase